MNNLILFNKPFQVLSQFTDEEGRLTLADFIKIKDFYPAGRLDYDSEGLLILTNEGKLQNLLSDPKHKLPKVYWVQVEGLMSQSAISNLEKGVVIKGVKTKPAKAERMNEPKVWERNPPIRERKNIQTSWIKLQIAEGRNRQVRKMTAAVGYPTLRLIRYSIGDFTIEDLFPGKIKTVQIPKKYL